MARDLTSQQALFCERIAAGDTRISAYLFAYPNAKNGRRSTQDTSALRLSKRPQIRRRLAEIQAEATTLAAAASAWNVDRLVSEAETNLDLARSGGPRSVSAANGSLELIARVAGLLSSDHSSTTQAITRVTVVLNRALPAGEPEIIEAHHWRTEGETG
tara:strand:+ start:176 stop:652 length:477 start_codon:yes stop_codon:yes gene_type:complete